MGRLISGLLASSTLKHTGKKKFSMFLLSVLYNLKISSQSSSVQVSINRTGCVKLFKPQSKIVVFSVNIGEFGKYKGILVTRYNLLVPYWEISLIIFNIKISVLLPSFPIKLGVKI